MGEVRAEIVIQADPKAVWAVLTDVGGWSDWNEVMVDGQCDGGLGSRVSCKVAVGPVMFPVDSKMVTWEVDRAMAWGEHRGRALRVDHGFTLQPEGEGKTRIVHYEHFEGAVGRMLYPLIRESLSQNYATFLEALKQRVER